MIVKINNIDEYKKVSKRITWTRWNKSKELYEDPNFEVGYSWVITDPELMKNPEVREIFGSNSCICDEFIKYKDKICSFANGHTIAVLIGVEITEEDFYYIVKDSEGEIQYHSCVGNIELA